MVIYTLPKRKDISTHPSKYEHREKELKQNGASEAEVQRSALITGGFIGLTDRFGYGKTLETLNTGAGASTWRAVFSEAVKDGGRNAGVAGVQTVFENGVARNTYDPKRGYLDNVRERMMTAGITGAALKGGLEIIGKVRQGANPQVLAETQKIFRIEKSPIEINAKQLEYRNSGIDLKAKLNEKLKTVETKESVEEAAKQSALKLEKSDGEHSLDRHGPEISDAKLKTRPSTGIAADGKFSPTKASTRFNSYEDWSQTRNAAWEQIRKTQGTDFSKPPTKTTSTRYEIIIRHYRK